MIESEAFQLLTLASARDGRTVTQAVARVWADDLAHIDVFDAVDAARMHYRESDQWLMPAHIIKNVRRVKDERARERRVEAARRGIARAPMPPRPDNYNEMVLAAIEQHRGGRD